MQIGKLKYTTEKDQKYFLITVPESLTKLLKNIKMNSPVYKFIDENQRHNKHQSCHSN